MKILVIRNDKIGDFMLAWPAFRLLKQQYPEARVTALVPSYTEPLARLCPWIDDIIIDQPGSNAISDVVKLASKLRQGRFDHSISFYSQTRTALALLLAGVRSRIGPATKIARLFLNRTLLQKRSRSAKPEYEYNIDLVRHFASINGDDCDMMVSPPYLEFDAADIVATRKAFIDKHALPSSTRLVVIHPGSGGSAINLSLEQYAALASRISERDVNVHIVITSGPSEESIADQLSSLLKDTAHTRYHSNAGLPDFCRFLACCDMFIGGSTGPLHIAAAANIRTAAFYPSKRSATALRWQTINDPARALAFTAENDDMSSFDIEACARQVSRLLSGEDER